MVVEKTMYATRKVAVSFESFRTLAYPYACVTTTTISYLLNNYIIEKQYITCSKLIYKQSQTF